MTVAVFAGLAFAAQAEHAETFLGLPMWIWQLLNLIGFLGVLGYFVARPLARAFGARQQAVEARILEARQRRQEAARRAGGDDLGAVSVVRREPRRDHARCDGRARFEPDARRARDERRREAGLAADEMRRAGGVEVDGAVGRELDAIGERRRDVDERALCR